MKILLAFILTLTLSYSKSLQKELTITACGITRVAFVKKLVKEFNKTHSIKVHLNNKGGVNRAINDVYSKKADIGFGCRALFKDKKESSLDSEQVAWGTVAFLTNKSNSVTSITMQQAKDILKGKITNWRELGGENRTINLYLRKGGLKSGVGYSVRKELFKNLDIQLSKSAKLVKNSDELRVALLRDKYGFAVGDGASAIAFGKLKILKVNGVFPNKVALKSKKYSLLRPYFVYLPKKLTPEAKIFLNFTLTKYGQNAIKKTEAVSLGEGERDLRNLTQQIKNEKLSSDNTVSMDSIVKRYANSNLNVFSCGITRVAFVHNLIESFSKKYGVKISTNNKGGVGFVLDKLYKKESDISFVCRKPFKEGSEKNLWCVQVAWGALGFIVNPNNKINNLTKSQIKAILTGKIKNWKELGWEDAPIHLVLRKSPKSGVGSTLREILFKDKNYKLNSAYKLVKNSGQTRDTVANDKFAIAVDDVTSSQRVKSVKLINVDDVKPTKETIIDGDYKYRRPFFACMIQKYKKLAKLFLNYSMSNGGQKVISISGTANLAEGKSRDSQNNFILQQLKFRMQGRTKSN